LENSKPQRFVPTLRLASKILRGASKQCDKSNNCNFTETTESATEEDSGTSTNDSRNDDVCQFQLLGADPDLDDLSSVGMRNLSYKGAMHTSRQNIANYDVVFFTSLPECCDNSTNDYDDDDLSTIGMRGISQGASFFVSLGSLIEHIKVDI